MSDRASTLRAAACDALTLEPLSAAYVVHAIRIGMDRAAFLKHAADAFDNTAEAFVHAVAQIKSSMSP